MAAKPHDLLTAMTNIIAELRALDSTGSSSGVALTAGPEPDELADFGSALVPGGRSSRPNNLSSLRTEDHSALNALLCRRICCVVLGGQVLFCPSAAPGFPRVPSCSLEDSVEIAGRWDIARSEQHSRRSATSGNGRGDRI
jgi:hypothetical protein